jgi:two-component system sensor histidine kinase QseC
VKSIRQHLTLTIVSGFGVLLLVGGLAIYFFTRVALLDEFDAGLRAKALVIVSRAEQDNDGLHVDLAEIAAQGGDVMPQFFELWEYGGKRAVRSESLHGTDLPQRSGPLPEPAYWNLDLPGDFAGRAMGLKFSPAADDEKDKQPTTPAQAILVVAADRRPLDQTLTLLAAILLATGLLTLAATVPVVRFSLRRGHAPLEQLSRQAAGITAESLQSRFPTDSMPEELLPITTRLNDLLRRLKDSFERERRFSADLAHELRTPLAELRTHAEVEIQWIEGGEAGKHRETLEIALQMEGIVTRLLELARCENSKLPVRREPIPLQPLVEDVWRSLAGKANIKQLAVNFTLPSGAVIETDRALFRSILTNLLSNAVEYSPQNGRVEIHWRANANELAISNAVYNLTPDDLPHLFERLWRKDTSRTGGEHFGLGLSLSRGFAALLGLNLTAHFSNPTTLTLVLRDV